MLPFRRQRYLTMTNDFSAYCSYRIIRHSMHLYKYAILFLPISAKKLWNSMQWNSGKKIKFYKKVGMKSGFFAIKTNIRRNRSIVITETVPYIRSTGDNRRLKMFNFLDGIFLKANQFISKWKLLPTKHSDRKINSMANGWRDECWSFEFLRVIFGCTRFWIEFPGKFAEWSVSNLWNFVEIRSSEMYI